MIGKELAKAIKNTRGKILINMTTPFGQVWVNAEKSHLADWAKGQGDNETEMKLFHENDEVFLDFDLDAQNDHSC